jgi:phospho-N-acetylmuramoyl-pentapeptide-transferase
MNEAMGQMIFLGSLIGSVLITVLVIQFLLRSSSQGTIIRDQGPESHKEKSKTPSTGGRAFLIVLTFIGLPATIMMNDPRGVIAIATGILTGLIGIADDMLKVSKKSSSGLKARYKLPLQMVTGLMACFATYYLIPDQSIRIPFTHELIEIGLWKIPLGLFCYLTIVNAVNFTDGLDGLAASTVIVAALFLGGSIWMTSIGAAVVPVILVGMCATFLFFNWHPAKIFMGDSGALALGGALAATGLATHLELVLLIIGLVFIIEISSVVLQVVYFRLTHGKRIFRMTPIHHAWELRGFKESQIVFGAVAIGIIAGFIGLVSVWRQ